MLKPSNLSNVQCFYKKKNVSEITPFPSSDGTGNEYIPTLLGLVVGTATVVLLKDPNRIDISYSFHQKRGKAILARGRGGP
jgi:hypothetical protein